MTTSENIPITISLDLKKYRIRMHKSMLHLLGDPLFIQLLIDPDRLVVGIKAVDRFSSGDQTHKVSRKTLKSGNSVEIYSRYFISKLNEVVGILDDGNLYHMDGMVIPSERVAVFSMKSLKKAEA